MYLLLVFFYFLAPTLVRFDPVAYSVTEAPVWLSISFVTSQPLLGESTVRLYDIPTAGATNQATGEFLNYFYNFCYVSIHLL